MRDNHGNSEASQAPRRFYKSSAVHAAQEGYALGLDGRGARTPAGLALVLPTLALAELVAEEWNAQGEHIRMASMPATRLAFTTIDRVAAAREDICTELGRYAGADLLCYFADHPESLVERQLRAWGPVLEWAQEALELRFVRTSGVAHVEQPAETLLRVARLAGQLDDFALAGLAHATGLFSSTLLGFALQRDKLDGQAAFELSQLDETFQNELWGIDEEAAIRTGSMRAEALMLERWFGALRS